MKAELYLISGDFHKNTVKFVLPTFVERETSVVAVSDKNVGDVSSIKYSTTNSNIEVKFWLKNYLVFQKY